MAAHFGLPVLSPGVAGLDGTTPHPPPAHLAVGVGGAGGWYALAWAGERALRSASRLVILHASPPQSPLARRPGVPSIGLVELVDPPLARAVSAARAKLGNRNVSLRILDGDPGAALAEATTDAGMLVIGAGGGGSTVRRVIRHARCPVVVARPGLGDHDAPFAGQVVVGVDAGPATDAALGFAFEYADRRRLTVTAVHVTKADPSANVSRSGDLAAAMDLLRSRLEPWKRRYPQVPVRSTVLHGEIGSGLIRAGAGADLLVIGDPHRGAFGRARTGDLPLTVAQRSRGPVAVVPASSVSALPEAVRAPS
jgi:nucleotide-binding universal stress UspA family protein